MTASLEGKLTSCLWWMGLVIHIHAVAVKSCYFCSQFDYYTPVYSNCYPHFDC